MARAACLATGTGLAKQPELGAISGLAAAAESELAIGAARAAAGAARVE
jgi:hypothetical protein